MPAWPGQRVAREHRPVLGNPVPDVPLLPRADNTDEAKALHDLLERLTSGGSEQERGAAAADIAKHVQAAGAASMQVHRQRALRRCYLA